MNKTIILIASLLLLPSHTFATQTFLDKISQAEVETTACKIAPENPETGEYSEKKLQSLAKNITVKVIGDNNGGSGTLLAKKGDTYLVMTNSHVVRGVNSIKLQTSDGKTYSAQILPKTNFDKFDLALIQFQSNQTYCLPQEIAASVPNPETLVMAAGYSSEKGELVFRTGKIQQIAQRPLKEGYQIGYTSDIEQGMSGGVILNSRGELIGINGRSAYPILNTGYVYPDNSRPTEAEIQEMRKLSWGIPVSTFLAQVNTEILTAYSLPLPKSPDSNSPIKLTGWLGELEEKAKKITVRIDSTSGANGSGVIIAKNGDTYTVLTAAHVLCERQEAKQPCGDYKYQILAPDGKQYLVDKSTIKTEEGVDLGVFKFTASNQNYQVATLANYNPNTGNYMFTAGYPKLGDKYSPWRLTIGQIFEKELGLLQSRQSDFQTDSSGRLQTASSLTGGYELVYTSITYGGMSGGPVLDSLGRVIGIHGRAEGQIYEQYTKEQIQLGYSLGIPVSTFLGIAKRFEVQPQKVETISAPQLNTQQSKAIQEAVLSINVSRGNTTARQWIERGNQLWRLRRSEEAVIAFDTVIKQNSNFVYLAYYGKSLVLFQDRKYKESIAALESAVKLKPDFVSAWQSLSVFHRRFKQLDKALVAIEKAIIQQPNNPNLYNEKYAILNGLKRYLEAEITINKAIEIHPRAVFYNNRGVLYYQLKKWNLALADFNKTITINPESVYGYNNRGLIYEELQKWDLALVDFNKAIAINSEFAYGYNNRGFIYKELQKWDLALVDFNKAIAIDPELAQAYYNRGVVYDEQNQWGLALTDYNKVIAINPNDADIYNNRAGLYYKLQEFNLALNDYNKAIEINPILAPAYYNRGILYYKLQEFNLALNDYNKAIKINPMFALAYKNRGILYYELKKWNLALADFNKNIAINPNDAVAYHNRGLLYEELKKWDLALADYTKAIAIDPKLDIAYNNRGLLYQNFQEWDLAVADYTKAITINPDKANAYYNRGLVYSEKGDKQKAIQDLQQAARLFQAQENTVSYERVINFLKELQQ
ncbi:tetratricopeptide repeat protein [Aulosira sp. FACHB-113]|nr:tetratricopeptide repeat protein [Aulosira sp. FACHB-113]